MRVSFLCSHINSSSTISNSSSSSSEVEEYIISCVRGGCLGEDAVEFAAESAAAEILVR